MTIRRRPARFLLLPAVFAGLAGALPLLAQATAPSGSTAAPIESPPPAPPSPSPASRSATRAGDEALKTADHEALAKQIAGYFKARRKEEGVDKAREQVKDELDRIKKKLKGRDPLSLTSDLGKALWHSFDYESAKGVTKGKVKEVKAPEEGMDVTYATWVPAKYDPKKAYPLVLCIPDKGAKVTDHLTEKWLSADIRDNAILAAVPMPGDDIATWADTGVSGKPGGGAHVLIVFREVSRTYAIDFDRVFLAGRGEGVAAAVAIASRYPDRLAGVIGRSGDPSEIPCENFRNLPTFFAGGGAGATAFSEKGAKAGYNNCTLKPEGQEADVWAWIQDHPRISNPAEVVLLPGVQFPNKAYWLQIPPWDGQGTALIKATIDRGSNTVVVDGEGMTQVELYFNDVLVDMDKPVKVVCNGAEHLDVIPRNLTTTLDLFVRARSDPGKVYTATKQYDLPAKPKPK